MKGVIVKAPAKLVITGEYSSLYDKKIITCAISKYITFKMKLTRNKNIKIRGEGFKIKLSTTDFSINKEYNDFILEIIRNFVATTKIDIQGLNIVIKNKIPVNCGIGSRSSTICGVLYGLNELFSTRLSEDEMVNIAIKLEEKCYGKSNRIDARTTLNGGVLVLENGNAKRIPHSFNDIYIINTGRPIRSSKEVINMVEQQNGNNIKIWNDFDVLADDIEQDIVNCKRLTTQIAYNNKLLEKLGIISNKVSCFIQTLLTYNIYSKMCGYGTIANKDKDGKNGVVAVFHKLSKTQIKALKKTSRRFGFKVEKVTIVNGGIEIEKF